MRPTWLYTEAGQYFDVALLIFLRDQPSTCGKPKQSSGGLWCIISFSQGPQQLLVVFNNAISTFSPWPTFHFRKWISNFDSLCNTIKRYPLWPGLELYLNPFGIFLLHRRYFPLGWLNWITRQQKNKTIWLVVGKLINPIRKRNQLGNDRIWVVPFPNCRVRFTKLSG